MTASERVLCNLLRNTLAGLKMLHPHPRSHVIVTWVLGNLFPSMTSCQARHNLIITICYLLGQLPQKVKTERPTRLLNDHN